MHIKDKIKMSIEELKMHGPINIVAFGDSVTHGALRGYFNYETVYHNLLKKKILNVCDNIPVNIINAGIGGISASGSVARVESQALTHNPDLIIICFGLNDVNEPLDAFISSLRIIFEKCKAADTDIIYMTPNMLNTYVAEDTQEQFMDYAAVTADYQNNGRMDLYMKSATDLAKEMDIPVCDCYNMWKELSKTKDVTQLLINRINHPAPEMHELFAESLFNMIFDENDITHIDNENAMYQEKA